MTYVCVIVCGCVSVCGCVVICVWSCVVMCMGMYDNIVCGMWYNSI